MKSPVGQQYSVKKKSEISLCFLFFAPARKHANIELEYDRGTFYRAHCFFWCTESGDLPEREAGVRVDRRLAEKLSSGAWQTQDVCIGRSSVGSLPVAPPKPEGDPLADTRWDGVKKHFVQVCAWGEGEEEPAETRIHAQCFKHSCFFLYDLVRSSTKYSRFLNSNAYS